jgi:hypothetical protein
MGARPPKDRSETVDDRIFLNAAGRYPNVRNYLTQIGTRDDLKRTGLVLKDSLQVKS